MEKIDTYDTLAKYIHNIICTSWNNSNNIKTKNTVLFGGGVFQDLRNSIYISVTQL